MFPLPLVRTALFGLSHYLSSPDIPPLPHYNPPQKLHSFFANTTKQQVFRKRANPSVMLRPLAFHARRLDGTDEAVLLRKSF